VRGPRPRQPACAQGAYASRSIFRYWAMKAIKKSAIEMPQVEESGPLGLPLLISSCHVDNITADPSDFTAPQLQQLFSIGAFNLTLENSVRLSMEVMSFLN